MATKHNILNMRTMDAATRARIRDNRKRAAARQRAIDVRHHRETIRLAAEAAAEAAARVDVLAIDLRPDADLTEAELLARALAELEMGAMGEITGDEAGAFDASGPVHRG